MHDRRILGLEQASALCRCTGILWRRGLPQSPENRQDVATSITDVISIRFLIQRMNRLPVHMVYVLVFFLTPEICLDPFSTTTFVTWCFLDKLLFVTYHHFNMPQIFEIIDTQSDITIE